MPAGINALLAGTDARTVGQPPSGRRLHGTQTSRPRHSDDVAEYAQLTFPDLAAVSTVRSDEALVHDIRSIADMFKAPASSFGLELRVQYRLEDKQEAVDRRVYQRLSQEPLIEGHLDALSAFNWSYEHHTDD